VIEFRNATWFTADVYALLRERDVALAIADDRDFPFQKRELTTDWTYVRLHGGGRGAGGTYSKADLTAWKRRIAAWRARTEVLAYFNNASGSLAVEDAQALRAGLS
jgi:uncharacterized protein YecE (DUF72 family)